MKIIKAKLKDLKELIEIAAENINFHSKCDNSLYDANKAIDFYKKCLKKSIQKDIFFVAENCGRIIGYVYRDIEQWYPGYDNMR